MKYLPMGRMLVLPQRLLIRRTLILVLLMVTVATAVRSQSFPAFKQLRYDDDFSVLRNNKDPGWYGRFKYTPIGDSAYLSLGADVRYQYFYFANEGFGSKEDDNDGYMLSRLMVHGDLHVSAHLRVFAQLQSSMASGRIAGNALDENPLELHQGFVDLALASRAKTSIMFRLGRQEMAYGSQRLVSVREGPNNRQSFDGLKMMIHSRRTSADMFYTHHVAASKGNFNDRFNPDTKFWGLYLTHVGLPGLGNADIYYLGLFRRNALFDGGQGRELRHSVGSRLWRKARSWSYDAEFVYQFGSLAGRTISAWTASINSTVRLMHTGLQPELVLKTELISGDLERDDDRIQTFNALFPRGGYFGLASLIGPANLFDIHPSLMFSLNKNLAWTLDYDLFWRFSRRDGIYGPGGNLLFTGSSARRGLIGQQFSTDLAYRPNQWFGLVIECTWFSTGQYLHEVTPGKDILFAGVTTQLKF